MDGLPVGAGPARPEPHRAATANGTAAAGSDYTAVSTTVTFGAGETTKTVGVPVLGDGATAGDETLVLNLWGRRAR